MYALQLLSQLGSTCTLSAASQVPGQLRRARSCSTCFLIREATGAHAPPAASWAQSPNWLLGAHALQLLPAWGSNWSACAPTSQSGIIIQPAAESAWRVLLCDVMTLGHCLQGSICSHKKDFSPTLCTTHRTVPWSYSQTLLSHSKDIKCFSSHP